jgi:hypothetical protein
LPFEQSIENVLLLNLLVNLGKSRGCIGLQLSNKKIAISTDNYGLMRVDGLVFLKFVVNDKASIE